jgi:hypothetical protein
MTILDTVRPSPDRKLPAALVAAFLLQTAGALFWAGSAAQRIDTLERSAAYERNAIERIAVLEEDVRAMKQTLDRIDARLDRAPR